MQSSVERGTAGSHRVLAEMRPTMARATLVPPLAPMDIGRCLDQARRCVGLTLKELAAALGRDARQVRRWIDGSERTQMDVVFGVEALRAPFVLALAELAGLDVVTTISVRRTA